MDMDCNVKLIEIEAHILFVYLLITLHYEDKVIVMKTPNPYQQEFFSVVMFVMACQIPDNN
jgi:hypothetical protein